MATDSNFTSFCLFEGEKKETTNRKKKKTGLVMLVMAVVGMVVVGFGVGVEGLQLTI